MAIDPMLLEEAVGAALSRGASYAEARYHSEKSFNAFFLNGQLLGAAHADTTGVAVRVIVNGGMGFASTSIITKEGVLAAVERALSSARAASRLLKKGVSLSEERLGTARYGVVEKKRLDSLSEEDKIGLVKESLGSVEFDKGDMKTSTYTLSYVEGREEKVIVTSDGGYVESYVPRVSVFYNISSSSGEKRANRWNMLAGSGGIEVLEGFDLARSLQEDVDSLYVNLVEAGPPPKGTLDVILSPEIVGLAVHESAGHPSEADRVLGREAAQAGLSYRVDYGEEFIGSEHVTIVDDPTIPGSYGFYLYDDEGVPARKRVLIDRGRLGELLHNRETGPLYGVSSNAASRARDYRSEPIVRMANTYFAPGDYGFEELVEDVREGVYIKKYMEWNIDDYRWGARYVGLEAYLIKNGELSEPVRDVALEITTRDFYGKVDAVGKDLEFSAGTCGKGEPSQPMPVWMGGPHIRLRGVRL